MGSVLFAHATLLYDNKRYEDNIAIFGKRICQFDLDLKILLKLFIIVKIELSP